MPNKMSFLKEEYSRQDSKRNKGPVLIKQYRAIYFVIPKAACSSLKYVCLKLIAPNTGEIAFRLFHLITSRRIHAFPLPYIRKDDINKYPDYFKFCFVRNTWDRVVSCYLEKIREPSFKNKFFKNGIHRGFLQYNRFKAGMSFKEFVYAIHDIPDKKADKHFKAQHTFLTDKNGKLIVDFIGRFENLEGDFKELSKKAGFPNVTIPHMLKNPHKDYRLYYDDETKKLVAERYKKDIELFGHTFD